MEVIQLQNINEVKQFHKITYFTEKRNDMEYIRSEG
jgi:hypothetical protein